MAALTSDPTKTDPQFAGGLGMINPEGLGTEDLQKIRDATDKGITDLEHRYDKPNWFKVAAGFAKPQLGGFLASLGSASEAMGENVEQQRENILPITNLKIQRELANTLLGQKIKQKDMFDAWKASGKPMDEQTYTSIAALGNSTEIAQSAKSYWDQAKSRIGTTIEAAGGASNYPMLQAFQKLAMQASDPNASPADIQKRDAELKRLSDASRPPHTPVNQWNGMSLTDKMAASAKYLQDQQMLGMTEEAKYKFIAEKSRDTLPVLATIRDLALGKGLPKLPKLDKNGQQTRDKDGKLETIDGQEQMNALLGIFGGNNPFEAAAKAISEGKLGSLLEGADARVRQILMNPDSRAKFEELTKLLATNQVQLRNSTVNPTDAYGQLQQSSQPTTANSQQALIGILDLMAHTERHNVDSYKHIVKHEIPANEIGLNTPFQQKRTDYSIRHNKMLKEVSPYNTPSYYFNQDDGAAQPSSVSSQVAPAVQQATPAQKVATPASTSTPTINTPARIPSTQDNINQLKVGMEINKELGSPKKNSSRPDWRVGADGYIYVRDKLGHWDKTGEKP